MHTLNNNIGHWDILLGASITAWDYIDFSDAHFTDQTLLCLLKENYVLMSCVWSSCELVSETQIDLVTA